MRCPMLPELVSDRSLMLARADPWPQFSLPYATAIYMFYTGNLRQLAQTINEIEYVPIQ
jgi:hypothetical protein